MKVLEIINEDIINEAPASGFRQFGRKVAAYGLQKAHMKGAARAKGRQVDVDDEANRIKDDLATTIKGAGEKLKDLDVGYFKTFLAKAGFEDKDIDTALKKYAPQDELSKKAIDQIILGLTRNASKQTADVRRSKFATRKGGVGSGSNKSNLAKIPANAILKASDGNTYEWNRPNWINTDTKRPAKPSIAKELTNKFLD